MSVQAELFSKSASNLSLLIPGINLESPNPYGDKTCNVHTGLTNVYFTL